MTAPGTDWRKAGRDAAHEDAACEGADPCTTLDGARTRCAVWLEDVEGADVEPAAEGYLAGWTAHLRDAADTSAPPLDLGAVVAKWRRVGPLEVAHDEDGDIALTYVNEDDERTVVARMDCDDPGFVEAAEVLAGAHRDVRDLVAEVRRLRALHDATAQAFDNFVARVWAATGETHEPPADVAALLRRVAAARRDGAEAMREACAMHCDRRAEALDAQSDDVLDLNDPEDTEDYGRFAEALDLAAALRALPLPEVTP